MNIKKKEFFNARGWRLWLPSRRDGWLALLFLLSLSLPMLNQVFHFVGPYKIIEKRKLAEKPVFSWRQPFSYGKKYEAYYNDHFTFRTRWVHWNNLLTYKLFHTAASAKVIIGKQGWLFMGNINEYFNEYDYYRNLKPFTMRELRSWQILLEQRRNWLRRRGIRYLFAIPPNKSTIYAEFMPAAIKKVNPRSRLDQLLAHMEKHSTVDILDLRPALLAAKKIRPAYYRTDTHWNDWGAFITYREIIGYLRQYFPFMRPRPLDDFHIRRTEFTNGDLALMLTLPNIFRETQWKMEAKAPLQARAIRVSHPELRDKMATLSVHTRAGAPLPAALMVHDSFANHMKQYLSEDFSKIVYIWNWSLNFFDEIIEQEEVKIVIDEMVEYSLLSRRPVNPGELQK